METIFPNGISTSIFLRLFLFAFIIFIEFPLPSLLFFEIFIDFEPLKYCPVSDSLTSSMSEGVPSAMISPP